MTQRSIEYCGFVLAAGFGTRLRPITEHIPKPLIRFFGIPLIDLAFYRLRNFGINDNAINGHYLADRLVQHVTTSSWGAGVEISIESPKILGRGGAYIPLRGWFADRTIVAYNGDIISNINIREALETHKKSGAIATMVVLPAPLGRDNAVFCDQRGRIGSIAKSAPDTKETWIARGFACLQILEPEFLDLLPASGESDILGAYELAIARGHLVQSHVHEGFWHDLGSPDQLLQAHVDLINHENPEELARDLGLFAAHAAQKSHLKILQDGDVYENQDKKLTITGPAALIEAHDATQSAGTVAHAYFGPHAFVETGYQLSGPVRLKDVLVFRSARIDHSTAHSRAVYDHSVVISCSCDQEARD